MPDWDSEMELPASSDHLNQVVAYQAINQSPINQHNTSIGEIVISFRTTQFSLVAILRDLQVLMKHCATLWVFIKNFELPKNNLMTSATFIHGREFRSSIWRCVGSAAVFGNTKCICEWPPHGTYA